MSETAIVAGEGGSAVEPAVDVPARAAWWRAYDGHAFQKDLFAGLTVAAISLPQSIAYALIAGVDPRFGLYTAIVFTAIAAVFGSSRHLVNGPTGAVSLVVFSALAFIDPEARLDAFEAMALLTLMMGVIQIAIAVFRLGDATRYISESVVLGFISGAAALTIIGQVANLLGVKAQGTGHQHVLLRLWMTLTQAAPFNPKAILVGGGAIVLAIVGRALVRRLRWPQVDMFLVLVAVALFAYFSGWSSAPAGTKPAIDLIERVPSSLPGWHVPDIQWHWLLDMSSSAFAIAMLGLLEALAIAKAIAQKSGQVLDYNRQCMAEGIGNLVGGFFHCMPGSGSLSRTAINYQAGAMTRFSGVFCAAIVALAVLLFGPLTAYIPKAAIAGLLVVAAARLIDVERLRYTMRGSRGDAVLLAATALSALAIGVEFAIAVGVLLSLLWYVPRASKLKARELVVAADGVVRERAAGDPPPKDLLIIDVEGELFFGAAPELERLLQEAAARAHDAGIAHLVVRLKRARTPDLVAIERLDNFLHEARLAGLTVLLAGVQPELFSSIERAGLVETLGIEHVFREEDKVYSATLKAIRRAHEMIGIRRSLRNRGRSLYLV